MQSPQQHHNGEIPSRIPTPHFQSTISLQKLRRFNLLILLFRLATFCFTFTSAVFTFTNSRGPNSPHWFDFDSFRFSLAANTIVAIYSLVEMGASVWEISKGDTFFPAIYHVWFDFAHDQVFAYLLLSAESASMALARTMKGMDTCKASEEFCVQSDIAIALGFAGFLFLGFSCLLSGFRVVCFIISGSPFHI